VRLVKRSFIKPFGVYTIIPPHFKGLGCISSGFLEFFLLLMTKTQSVKFEIEKFNGKKNVEIWKVKMHDLLVQQGMVKAFLGKAKQPATITDEEWDEIDVRALSAICLCLVNDVLFKIVSEKTSINLWTKLERLYMTKSLTNKIFLKRQLYSLRMKEGTKIDDHLNVFNTFLVQLTSMRVKFESKDKEITLLCYLPESWDHFVTSISFSTIESIEFDVIVGALLSEETKKKSNLETSTSKAMMVRGRPKERGQGQRDFSRSNSKGTKSKLKCLFCGKSGHLIKFNDRFKYD
jgi:hypothetical protein